MSTHNYSYTAAVLLSSYKFRLLNAVLSGQFVCLATFYPVHMCPALSFSNFLNYADDVILPPPTRFYTFSSHMYHEYVKRVFMSLQ